MSWFTLDTSENKMKSYSSEDYKKEQEEKAKAYNIFDYFNEHNGKAMIATDDDGQWYYYTRKLIRFYLNNKNETVAICSFKYHKIGNECRFAMENGDKVIITYTNKLKILIADLGPTCYQYQKWVTPLTAEELKNYRI